LRHYEIVVLIHPDQSEQVPAMIDRYKKVVEDSKGTMHRLEDWGRRPLAYPIDKFERGYYYIIYFKAPAAAVKELERIYRITEEVLRFLTIKYETKKDIKAWEKMVERAKKLSKEPQEA